MRDHITQLAQSSALPVSVNDAGGFIAGAIATAAAIWAWFRSELTDCRNDRKELHAKIEALHVQVADLSRRIGRCERPPEPLGFDPCDWRPGIEDQGK